MVRHGNVISRGMVVNRIVATSRTCSISLSNELCLNSGGTRRVAEGRLTLDDKVLYVLSRGHSRHRQ